LMTNQVMFQTVRRDAELAVDWAVFQLVDWAVDRDVARAVYWDPFHPGLSAYFGSVVQ
jgi:hypothetical protein